MACVGFHLAQTDKKAPGLHFTDARKPAAQMEAGGAGSRLTVSITLPRAGLGLACGHREAPCCSQCRPVAPSPALSHRPPDACPAAGSIPAPLLPSCRPSSLPSVFKRACVPLYVWAKAAFVLCGESRILASLGRVELASCPSRGGLEGNRNLLSPGGELPGPEEDDVGKLEQSLPGSAADVRG